MTHKRIRAAWSYECILPTGVKIKSWFYSDSEEDVVKRITEYMGAKLVKIKQLDNPLLEIYAANEKKKEIKSNPLFKSL